MGLSSSAHLHYEEARNRGQGSSMTTAPREKSRGVGGAASKREARDIRRLQIEKREKVVVC